MTDEAPVTLTDRFRRFATRSAGAFGSPWAFVTALALCGAWAVSGPLFHWSDTWQLTINTGTTIVTFLAVFLIQSSQNRDSLAIQLKLDELLRAVDRARTGLVHLEDFSDEQLESLRREFEDLRRVVPKAVATTPTRTT